MAFRNRVTQLSQLIADEIIGAVFETAAPPLARLKIFQDAFDNGAIFIYQAGDDDNHAAQIWSNGGVFNFLGPGDKLLDNIPGLHMSGRNPGLFNVDGKIKANDGLEIGFNLAGGKINVLDWGSKGATNTNASGDITVAHNLQAIPQIVIWHDDNGNNPFWGHHVATSDTINNFGIRFRKSTDNTVAPAGTSVSGAWIAIA